MDGKEQHCTVSPLPVSGRGRGLGFSRRQALKLSAAAVAAAALAACGAPARPQAIIPGRNTAASKADGRILFAKTQMIDNGGKDDGIYALQNGSNVIKLLSKGDGDYALQYPRWSPDGTRIAFVRAGDGGIFSDLWIVNTNDANSARRITDFQSKIPHKNNVDAEGQYVTVSAIVAGLSWSQGGNFITFACDKNYAAMRPWTLEKPDDPPTLQTLHVITATQGFSPPNVGVDFHVDNTALAPDGSVMAFSGLWAQADNYANKQTQIYSLDFATRKYTQLTDLPVFGWGAYDPAFSPDGQQIAFAARPDYRVNDLHIMGRDGKNAVQITQTGAARSPVWSPDGKKLAFLAAFEGAQFNIYVMDVTPPAPGAPYSAANFSKPQKLTDEKGIDASSGLCWAQ
jgi:dipeptidyl aminopeptidase/acylaminoacyl peptidase